MLLHSDVGDATHVGIRRRAQQLEVSAGKIRGKLQQLRRQTHREAAAVPAFVDLVRYEVVLGVQSVDGGGTKLEPTPSLDKEKALVP